MEKHMVDVHVETGAATTSRPQSAPHVIRSTGCGGASALNQSFWGLGGGPIASEVGIGWGDLRSVARSGCRLVAESVGISSSQGTGSGFDTPHSTRGGEEGTERNTAICLLAFGGFFLNRGVAV